MRGHITKRAKSSYSLAISLGKETATGKYKYQWTTVRGTKKEADKRLSELLNQLDNGTFMKPSKTTLGEYLEKWLIDYAYPNLSPRTTEGYEAMIINHVIPIMGHVELTRIKPEHIQHYIGEKLKSGRCDGKGGLNPRTVRHHVICLRIPVNSATCPAKSATL